MKNFNTCKFPWSPWLKAPQTGATRTLTLRFYNLHRCSSTRLHVQVISASICSCTSTYASPLYVSLDILSFLEEFDIGEVKKKHI